MTNVDVIRAWTDEEYRLSLSAAELAVLPANPAGMIELSDADLDAAVGACCTPYCNGTSGCSQYRCYTCAAYPCSQYNCSTSYSPC
jgi:mersacidin/lichenicidin family type 2 lantibiotic